MKRAIYLLTAVILLLASSTGYAQFRKYGIKGGVQFQPIMPLTEYDSKFSWMVRGFLDFELTNTLALEIGGGYGQFNTEDNFHSGETTTGGTTILDYDGSRELKTNLIPIDARLKLAPWSATKTGINPYFYLGAGLLNFDVTETPDPSLFSGYSEKESGWTGFIPAGIGMEIKLSKNVLMDVNAGVTYNFSDLPNNFVLGEYEDSYLIGGIGLTFAGGEDCTIDTDKDGLTDCTEEKRACLDPNNPDTDGDGLKDGEEVNTYKTDPCNKDTDGDGLQDGEEVKTYRTNPLMKDTDGEGLLDYEEVMTFKTDPLDTDSDNDNLNDFVELKTHGTNPLNPDTDGGSIWDGIEVSRGTDPLVAADDIPVKEEPKVKVGQTITLEGITFATNSHQITGVAEEKLEIALSSLRDHPDVRVEISGHTDNTGGRAWNEELSLLRANSVKDWFVSKGIDPNRITTVGYAWDKPVDTNETAEGRERNRRIDFTRLQ